MDFKKTLLIICLFLGLNTFAQNQLQFNRVIDTVLSITIPVGVNMSSLDAGGNKTSGITYGDFISPANGKVWKVESIMIQTPVFLAPDIMYCAGGQYSCCWSNYLMIQSVLRSESIIQSLYERPANLDVGGNLQDSPLWIDNAEIGIAFRSKIEENVCLSNDYTAYVFLSLIEFNTD